MCIAPQKGWDGLRGHVLEGERLLLFLELKHLGRDGLTAREGWQRWQRSDTQTTNPLLAVEFA